MLALRRIAAAVMAASSLLALPQARADITVADAVLDFSNSGANPAFPTDSYGGTFPGVAPIEVPLSYAADGDATTFVSLPTGSFITLGFTSSVVFDGPGLDLFVAEVGGNDETAEIYVSSDFGASFTLLGIATTATVTGFDLASIGYTDLVNTIKVVGLDNLGGSPGFDLAYVQGLAGSVAVNPVPEPSSMLLLALGLAAAGAVPRRG